MFNVCPRCGEYSDDKRIDVSGPFAICPHCGHRHRFVRLPLFVVTGASGTGKTSVALRLASEINDYVWMESDIIWGSAFHASGDGYRAFHNLWLRIAKNIAQAGRSVVLFIGGVPAQFEACAERRYFSEVHYLALVCDEDVLVRRLTTRPRWRNWADPAFARKMLSFNAWLRDNAAKTKPRMALIDTSAISEAETARRVAAWVRASSGV